MPLRSAAIGAALALSCGAVATATPVQDAAVAFGLPGVWAPDCSKAPGLANGYERWSLSEDGSVQEITDPGAGYQTNVYRWTEGALVGGDQLRLDGVYVRSNEMQHDVMRKIDGRLQTWQAEGGGKKLITDGRVPIYVIDAISDPKPGDPPVRIIDTGRTREADRVEKCDRS